MTILGAIGQVAATGVEIGTLYGTGAANVLLGAGGAASYRKPLQQRKEEIGRLQAIFNTVQNFFKNPDIEERGEILASYCTSEQPVITESREDSFRKEDS